MARKYAKDYRLENVLAPSGKLKTVAVYDGELFAFSAPDAVIRTERVVYSVLTGVCILLLFYLLWCSTDMQNAWYVFLAPALSAPVMAFLLGSVYRLLTAKPPVTRECRDRLYGRLTPVTIILSVLAGLGFLGSVAHLFVTGTAGFRQILYCLAAALYTACALAMFLRHGKLKMEPCASK